MKRKWFYGGLLTVCLATITSCSMDVGRAEPKNREKNLPVARYMFGMDAITDNPASYNQLLAEYEDWKSYFVVPGNVGLRVRRGSANSYDTVSEGVAYGMLLAYFFDDQHTFDGLWEYALAHMISPDVPLMHWRVHPDGTNISEYNEPVEHGPVWVRTEDLWKDWYGEGIDGDPGPGMNYINTLNYANTLESEYYLTLEEMPPEVFEHPGPAANKIKLYDKYKDEYRRLCYYGRKPSSASDADFDMAAALCFAASNEDWAQSSVDYSEAAKSVINAILDHDITSSNFIRNGNAWGDEKAWNPSYFSPAWFRVYIAFIEKNPDLFGGDADAKIQKLNSTINNVYNHFKLIDSTNVKGMVPDWCDTSNNWVSAIQKTGSDRYYILDSVQLYHNWSFQGLQSFNYYYDAIRTTWRLAVDYSWYGDACPAVAENLLNEMATGFTNPDSIVDGYFFSNRYNSDITWRSGHRDGFNPGVGGEQPSTAFNAMIACSKIVLDTPSEDFYQSVLNGGKDPNSDGYAYYPNTLRLLSLLYLSGYFENPLRNEPAPDYIDLTGLPSNQIVSITESTTFLIDLGHTGVFQLNNAEGDNVQVAINGGAPMNKPADWGGAFYNLGSYARVRVEIITNSPVELNLQWW